MAESHIAHFELDRAKWYVEHIEVPDYRIADLARSDDWWSRAQAWQLDLEVDGLRWRLLQARIP